MKLYINNPRRLLVSNVKLADTYMSRLKGLMFKNGIPEDFALIITPCRSIHMFFMKFPIDVLFVDKNNKVVDFVKGIKPWRVSKTYFKADYVIEMPINSIDRLNINKGDILYIDDK